ncbi:hypothetical protein, conserved [Eimeria tenella]|uniref:Uncharacterized protein n=1 Tax=Eimeria tenella TaxID=5802 RepID=U6KPP6_EIMTE|nr:hypothetical protein, conserved [Eimeria tenella]CDJ37408.1 hypothetical protein, conserved [Eimeria tenella]|eukprot:XP_013228246.1 hypothetical protein, conserved [Eimeria tenella]
MASAASRGLLLLQQPLFPFLVFCFCLMSSPSFSYHRSGVHVGLPLSAAPQGASQGPLGAPPAALLDLHGAAQEDVDTPQEPEKPHVTSKPHLFSVEELLQTVAKDHWQPLEVLLARGASRGSLAKVVLQQQQQLHFAEATKVAKNAIEVCEADQQAEACSLARQQAKEASVALAPPIVGKFTKKKESDEAAEQPPDSSAEARSSSSSSSSSSTTLAPSPSSSDLSSDGSSNTSSSDGSGDRSNESSSSAGGSDEPSSSSGRKSRSSSSREELEASLLQLQGVIGSIWDTLFGGSSTANAENFEGGNQGSYFNFMYPSDNDYPWACVCDETQYAQWANNEVSYVSCRNQVDLSSQNVVAMCNPLNHKMNAAAAATPAAAAVAAVAFAAVAVSLFW